VRYASVQEFDQLASDDVQECRKSTGNWRHYGHATIGPATTGDGVIAVTVLQIAKTR